MKTVTITESSGITLVDVLMVEPRNQDKLVNILVQATETTLRHMPGYISSVIHKSVDGKKVTSYEQWERLEDFEAMFQRPEVRQWVDRWARSQKQTRRCTPWSTWTAKSEQVLLFEVRAWTVGRPTVNGGIMTCSAGRESRVRNERFGPFNKRRRRN